MIVAEPLQTRTASDIPIISYMLSALSPGWTGAVNKKDGRSYGDRFTGNCARV